MTSPPHNFNRQYNVLFIGEDLVEMANNISTKGYLFQLRDALMNKAAFYDLGIKGATAKQLLDIISHSKTSEMYPSKIDKIYLNIGLNENTDKYNFKQYLEKLGEKLFSKITKNVAIILPPECKSDVKRKAEMVKINEILTQYASQRSLTLIDIRTVRKEAETYQTADFLYNEIGNNYISQLVKNDIGFLKKWHRVVHDANEKWKYCDDAEFSSHLEENQETGECECQKNYYLDVKCELCPNSMQHSSDKRSCQCFQQFEVFDLNAKKCVCAENTHRSGFGECVPLHTEEEVGFLNKEIQSLQISMKKEAASYEQQINEIKNSTSVQKKMYEEKVDLRIDQHRVEMKQFQNRIDSLEKEREKLGTEYQAKIDHFSNQNKNVKNQNIAISSVCSILALIMCIAIVWFIVKLIKYKNALSYGNQLKNDEDQQTE